MSLLNDVRLRVLLFCVAVMLQPVQVAAQNSGASSTAAAAAHDGQHDFDWDIGAWKIHVRRLLHPLTGSPTWVEYNGTDIVRKIWDGRANLGEVEWDGPAGHVELLTLRLYNPETRQWSMNIASSAGGTLSPPAVGEFRNGRGEFYDEEPYNGRNIRVRFNVLDITATSCRFEQAFSADGGKTWETNLIVTETLMKDEPAKRSELRRSPKGRQGASMASAAIARPEND